MKYPPATFIVKALLVTSFNNNTKNQSLNSLFYFYLSGYQN